MALIYALDRPWMSRWESSGRREEHARSFRWSRGTGDLRQLRKNWQPLVRVRRKKERKEEKTEEHRSVEQPRLLLTIELDNNAANEPTTRSHNEPSRLPTFLNSPLVDILCVSRLLTPRKSLAKETTRGFDEDDGYHVSLRWSPPSTMINDDNNRGSFVALPSILLDFSTSRRVERQLVELDEFGQLWLRTRDKPRRRSRENSLWNSLTDFGSGTRSDEWNANRNSREARAKLTRAVTRSTVLYEWLVFPPRHAPRLPMRIHTHYEPTRRPRIREPLPVTAQLPNENFSPVPATLSRDVSDETRVISGNLSRTEMPIEIADSILSDILSNYDVS